MTKVNFVDEGKATHRLVLDTRNFPSVWAAHAALVGVLNGNAERSVNLKWIPADAPCPMSFLELSNEITIAVVKAAYEERYITVEGEHVW